jgi:hypothetical protein
VNFVKAEKRLFFLFSPKLNTMKKLLLANLLFLSCLKVNAQFASENLKHRTLSSFSRAYKYEHNNVLLVDTPISVYADRASAAYLYQGQAPDKGYVFGTYYYFDTGNYYKVTEETGIGFDAVMDADIIDVLFWAGVKYVNGSADSLTMKIYSTGADSMPVSVLASGKISMDDVSASSSAPQFTDVQITNGTANINSPFFVSLAYNGDDSLGLFTSAPGDGNNEKRIRQLTTPHYSSMWIRPGDLFTFTDVDLFFIPIATINNTGTHDHFLMQDAKLMPVYPAPANDLIHLDYTLATNSIVSFVLFDLKGKKYYDQKSEQQHAGTYSQAINLRDVASGIYYLSVSINGKTVTQKVAVTK